MKIKELNFLSFGQFTDRHIGLNEGVNVIYGKNESGKSTIAEGIITLLYGIYPTSKEKNLLVNWDNQELSIRGIIQEDESVYEVNRELLSQPTGSVKLKNEISQINNNTLKLVRRISMNLYRDLYFLDTKMIDELQRDTWENIDSQMIFSYEKTGINNPEDVLREIDEELNEIWRESNRGNFRLKTIEAEIDNLEKKKSELVNIYCETKNDIDQIDSTKALITRQKYQLNKLEIKRRKIKELIPIANICVEKEHLKKKYVNYEIYKLLSNDIINDRKLLINQKENILDEIFSIEEEIEKSKLKKNNLSQKEETIHDNQEQIIKEIGKLKSFLNEKKIMNDLESKESMIVEEYNQLFYKIFNKICTKEDFNRIKNTRITEIHHSSSNFKMIIGFSLSIIAGSAAYYYNQLMLSIIFLSIGIATLMTFVLNKPTKKEFKGLTFSSDSLENFRRLKEKEYILLKLIEEKNQLNASLLKEEKRLKLFFSAYKNSDSLEVVADYFNSIFEVIKKKIDENKNINFLLKEFEITLKKKKQSFKKYEEQLLNIDESLRELSQSSKENGIEIFKNNQRIEEQLNHLENKIDLLEHGRMLLEDYRKAKEVISIETLNSLEIQIEQLSSDITDNQITLAKLEEKIKNVSITDEIQSVDTEIDLLILEKKELVDRKNKLLAMKSIIRKSNQSFKDDYQPNIIKEANEYFNAFTHSKYDKILINQETKDIYLDLGKYNKKIQSGFSRGTMDQLFLALRLGVINHYERNIKMPLILDEFFSNWDEERLLDFIRILKVIQNERQVIITTCKNSIVDTFSQQMGIHLIQIEGGDNE